MGNIEPTVFKLKSGQLTAQVNAAIESGQEATEAEIDAILGRLIDEQNYTIRDLLTKVRGAGNRISAGMVTTAGGSGTNIAAVTFDLELSSANYAVVTQVINANAASTAHTKTTTGFTVACAGATARDVFWIMVY